MTVTINKMSAGKGYEYLLRTVAVGDGDRSLSTSTSLTRGAPTIQQLQDALPSVPAVVLNGRLDVLAHNRPGRALF